MALNEIHVDAPPAAVFDVLADGWSFGHWVVGTKEVRMVEPTWPDPGAKIHHSVSLGPLTVEDSTVVEEAKDDRRLVLRARARPMGSARVTIDLAPDGDGTLVAMEERPVSGPLQKLFNGMFDATLLRGRNQESLRRLRALAELR